MPKKVAITTSIPPGVYRIVNRASDSSARCYSEGQVLVRSTLENPGPFELWTIGGDGSIQNVGLQLYVSVNSSGMVVTGENRDQFTFENTGDDTTFFISTGNTARRARDAGKVWNVDLPVVPIGNISVQERNGNPTQEFSLVLAGD